MDVYHIDRPLKESIMKRLKNTHSYSSIANALEEHWIEVKPKIMYIVDRQYGDINLNDIKKGLSMRCKVWSPIDKSKFVTELDIIYKKDTCTHCLMFDNVYCK